MKTLSIPIILLAFFSCTPIYKTMNAGKPWQNKIQQIPGRVECEYYNEGGEGVAYHDSDSINNGSGKLNPANGTYLNEFRMKEGVDISYTKEHITKYHGIWVSYMLAGQSPASGSTIP